MKIKNILKLVLIIACIVMAVGGLYLPSNVLASLNYTDTTILALNVVSIFLVVICPIIGAIIIAISMVEERKQKRRHVSSSIYKVDTV